MFIEITILVNVYGLTLQDDLDWHFWLQKVDLIHPSRIRNGMEYDTNLRFLYTLIYYLRLIAHTSMNQVSSSFTLSSQDFNIFSHSLILMNNTTSLKVNTIFKKDLKTRSLSGSLIHHYIKPYTCCLSKLILTKHLQ